MKPTQTIQPYFFGDPTKKTTCLWLKGLPKLKADNVVDPVLEKYKMKNGRTVTFGAGYSIQRDDDGKIIAWNDPRMGKIRSKTFPGIARAMAEQWG